MSINQNSAIRTLVDNPHKRGGKIMERHSKVCIDNGGGGGDSSGPCTVKRGLLRKKAKKINTADRIAQLLKKPAPKKKQ